MDAVFKALADPTRRSLLDELFREDGQTLGALEERFSMSRFGVMKHLKVLEDAGLVVTTTATAARSCTSLNPVPIRLVHDRWVSKYAEPWVAGLSGLKQELERDMEKVFEIYIRTTARALVGGDRRPRDPGEVQLRLRRDDRLEGRLADPEMGSKAAEADALLGDGEMLEVDPPHRLVHTMRALWSDDVKERRLHAGRVGHRAGRRLVPPHGHPRPDARGRQRSALRRLADDPLRASRPGSRRASSSPRPAP